MDYPQIVTILTQGIAPITTIIDAPWVNVTSVNGMTGDVVLGCPFPIGSVYLTTGDNPQTFWTETTWNLSREDSGIYYWERI